MLPQIALSQVPFISSSKAVVILNFWDLGDKMLILFSNGLFVIEVIPYHTTAGKIENKKPETNLALIAIQKTVLSFLNL